MIANQNNITNEQHAEFAAGARWVVEQAGADPALTEEVRGMFEALAVSLPRWPRPILFAELWQGFDLEALVVPPLGIARSTRAPAHAIEGEISDTALHLIGAAVWKGMQTADADMMTHESDCGTKVFVFLSSVRQTVLQAAGVDLLEESS